MVEDKKLCCQVNPVEVCRECREGMCEEHTKKRNSRTINGHVWCESCAFKLDDVLDLFEDAADKLTLCKETCDDLANEIDPLADHARCRMCRDGQTCADLTISIGHAVDAASIARRRLRKL